MADDMMIGILRDIQEKGYADIPLKDGKLCIEKRPQYCNRGAWWVKVFPNADQYALHIDEADMFPRYYFKLSCLVEEMREWIKKNHQEPI